MRIDLKKLTEYMYSGDVFGIHNTLNEPNKKKGAKNELHQEDRVRKKGVNRRSPSFERRTI